jgi:hypothetical protein
MREKILSYDARVKEDVEAKKILRYSGKGKIVAEICFDKKANKPVVFLWLPIPSSLQGNSKEQVSRVRLWIEGACVAHVAHIPNGLGKMKLQSEWDLIPRDKRPVLMQSLSYKSLIPVPIHWYSSLSRKL